MEVALNGTLKEFGVAAVFQFIGQQRGSGVLEVQAGDRPLRVHFDEGSVAWAEHEAPGPGGELAEMLVRCGLVTKERAHTIVDDATRSARHVRVVAVESGAVSSEQLEGVIGLMTDEVIFELLLLTRGRFDFSAESIEHDRPPEALLAAEQILMEGLRRVDEWHTFSSRLPARNAVLQRAATFGDSLQRVRAETGPALARLERLLQLVDGRIGMGRVIDLSRLGTFEAARLLVTLLDAGVLETVGTVRGTRRGDQATSEAGFAASVRSAAAALIPIALLGLVAWAAGEPVLEAAQRGGVPIEVRAFERAATAFETRRLRNAAEAYRHLWSVWPPTLAALDQTGWGSSHALATPDAGTYYYAELADGLLLLPPNPGTSR